MNKNKRLIWRIYPYFILVIVISLVSVAGYTSTSIRNFFLSQTRGDLETQAYLLDDKVSEFLTPVDRDGLKQFCINQGNSIITRITVILPDGEVIGDSDEDPTLMDNHKNRPEIISALDGEIGSSIRFSGTLSQNMMYLAVPIKDKDKGKVIAILRTSVPITSIEEELSAIQRDRIIWGLLTAILASGLALFMTRRISKPIEEMRVAAEHFAMGDLNYYLPVSDTLELASLATSMNDMAVQLDSRINTIVNQRNEYEAVLSSMIEGVVAIDKEERILNINQAAIQMLNIKLTNLKHLSIQELIRNSEIQKTAAQTLLDNVTCEKDITTHQLERERVLNLKCGPLFNSKNESIGALLVFNDVTQLRMLESIRKDFVANVSHELKTPLTTIKGFVETLLNGSVEPDSGDLERFLSIISKNAERLNTIIEDLLSLARIEKLSEKMDTRFERKPLLPLFETAVQLIQSKSDEKNITIVIECDAALHLAIDQTMFEQALVNLLDNAVKYSDVDSEIKLKAETDQSEIHIAIIDHGSGIHKKHIPRLFERFYRADKARSRELGGTGLGLAIVKHITQLHSGRVTIDSELNKGSTFTIHIPVT